uniref:Camp-dependent protein kinase catalytic subunit n=1 Tax=Triatoma infestans TaxID=30076 RepID=A0A171AUI5_TRIIF
MCAGYTPFYSKLEAKIYDNISRCRYEMPYHFSSDLKDLIRNILQIGFNKDDMVI